MSWLRLIADAHAHVIENGLKNQLPLESAKSAQGICSHHSLHFTLTHHELLPLCLLFLDALSSLPPRLGTHNDHNIYYASPL
jgi:hypothetical protein